MLFWQENHKQRQHFDGFFNLQVARIIVVYNVLYRFPTVSEKISKISENWYKNLTSSLTRQDFSKSDN